MLGYNGTDTCIWQGLQKSCRTQNCTLSIKNGTSIFMHAREHTRQMKTEKIRYDVIVLQNIDNLRPGDFESFIKPAVSHYRSLLRGRNSRMIVYSQSLLDSVPILRCSRMDSSVVCNEYLTLESFHLARMNLLEQISHLDTRIEIVDLESSLGGLDVDAKYCDEWLHFTPEASKIVCEKLIYAIKKKSK
jgi:hypothetical protein